MSFQTQALPGLRTREKSKLSSCQHRSQKVQKSHVILSLAEVDLVHCCFPLLFIKAYSIFSGPSCPHRTLIHRWESSEVQTITFCFLCQSQLDGEIHHYSRVYAILMNGNIYKGTIVWSHILHITESLYQLKVPMWLACLPVHHIYLPPFLFLPKSVQSIYRKRMNISKRFPTTVKFILISFHLILYGKKSLSNLLFNGKSYQF